MFYSLSAPLNLRDEEHRVTSSAITLAPAKAGDDELFYQTFASTRTEELALTGWNEEQKEKFLRMQFEAQRRSYRMDLPEAEYSVVRWGEFAAGRLILDRTAAEIHIVDIGLLPQFRRRGIGSVLMERIFEEAREAGKSVRLFVERFNVALQWYERLGFEVVSGGPIYLEMVWRPGAQPSTRGDHVAEETAGANVSG